MADAIKNFLQKNFLNILWATSAITALVVCDKMGAAWPQFQFFQYTGIALATAFVGYLTTFIGLWGYLTTRNGMMDAALENEGNLQVFTDLLSQPVDWANVLLITTLGYFASKFWPAHPPLTVTLQVMSIASLTTCGFSILRNFHVLRMYFKAAVTSVHAEEAMRDHLMDRLAKRFEEIAEEEQQNKSDENQTIQ